MSRRIQTETTLTCDTETRRRFKQLARTNRVSMFKYLREAALYLEEYHPFIFQTSTPKRHVKQSYFEECPV